MRVLFLDFDGVLNSRSTRSHLDEACVRRLNTIVGRTNCHIVLSTSWRQFYSLAHLCNLLGQFGFAHGGRIVGKTPCLPNGARDEEIVAWLEAYRHDVEAYSVLDDCQVDVPGFVHVNGAFGLSDADVDEVVRLLGSKHAAR